MNPDAEPLDAEVLMEFSERIAALPPAEAGWVGRLFDECLRARLHEAELLAASADESDEEQGLPAEHGALSEDLAQVALDTAEWLKTLWQVGYMGAGSFPSAPRSAFPTVELEDVLMSSLFARIRQGKRPLPFPPPTRNGSPWHELLEGESEAYVVDAEIVADADGKALVATIDACSDWRVVEELQPGSAYLLQHQGKGPLFRLHLAAGAATLRREPPRWSRVIALVERGGFRSFVLHWGQDDGREQTIPLRAATWERAESAAEYWIAARHPEMYGQIRFERRE
ncbi:hypothetical protein [Rhodocyclus tenuis]|uniref:hypothetical protein n=1 Tax=Rhodocyclus tenuis TaxID=1066 RepID=UPI0019044B9C|nr:hypothetical protein [Rhodocyclus tenuis]MBK1680296.1 hypothetical protein [Rhodocyclus tenuis]